MYLGGSTIDVRLPNGQIQSFGTITVALDQALSSGTAVNVYAERFAGGWLANGCPLNVYFGGAWLPGQKEALRAAGKTSCPGVAEPAQSTFTQTPAAGYTGGSFTAGGRQILPTGVQTPSAPITIITPAGPVSDFGLTPPPPPDEPKPQAAGMETGTMIIIGLALIGLLRR